MDTLRIFLTLSVLLFTGQAPALTSPDAPTHNRPLHAAFFRFGSDQLTGDERAAITHLAQSLTPRRKLRLVGYTDDMGPAEYNEDLARRRARAVRDVLVGAGYPRELLQIEGQAGAVTNGNRRQMRRVDIFTAKAQSPYADNTPFDASASDTAANPDVDPLRVGRYSVVAPVPRASQRDPLQALVRIRFAQSIHTVGDALNHLLARSGWRLVDPANAEPSLATLLDLPLPQTQRRLGPVPLIEAVRVLCGSAYEVVIDPVHRLLSCEIKAQFAAIGEAKP